MLCSFRSIIVGLVNDYTNSGTDPTPEDTPNSASTFTTAATSVSKGAPYPAATPSSATTHNPVSEIIAGICLVLFFACVEVLPFSPTLNKVSRRATIHLLVLLLPASTHGVSSLWLLVPGLIALGLAVYPFKYSGFKLWPALLIVGLSVFFILALTIPHPTRQGLLWSLFALPWIGANLWAADRNYFFSSVVGLFLWDLGSGAQAMAYGIRALSEPYGNGIPPEVVVIVDSVAICAVLITWYVGVDPKEILTRSLGRYRANFKSSN